MKLGVCVPYRNREEHFRQFVPKVSEYLKSQGIEDFCMYFGHQCDDKLFNRGMTKNIAAKYAFEDGCDYIVWHDIDMIPEIGGGADYSYPGQYPRHIATNISQMNYELKYFEYFGGAVLFTKDQVEKTNGYSNEYWDWGMEDDDLFWRCYLEGLLKTDLCCRLPNTEYYHFEGNSGITIDPKDFPGLRNFSARSHTISVLCRSFQQPEKQEIYLIGDNKRRYVEYPIFRIPGYDYGIGFNNSKTYSLQFWNSFNQHNYMWIKRYDQQWTWITATFDCENQEVRFYLNGTEIDSSLGQGSGSPFNYVGRLKPYGGQKICIGHTTSVSENDPARYFKGDIADILIWNRTLSSKEVKDSLTSNIEEGLLFKFNNLLHNAERSDIEVYDSMLPYRVSGRFNCLYHKDEGIVGGKFAKGEPTARNERRYMISMQQGRIDHKEDGINQLDGKYKLLSIEEVQPNVKMINVTV